MKRRHIYNWVLMVSAAVLMLASCATNEKADDYISPYPVIEEMTEEEQLEPVYKAPQPMVQEADEFVWSSILAMQNMKKEAEETAPAPLEEEAADIVQAEEQPAGGSIEGNISDEEIRAEETEAMLEEREDFLPDARVLDLAVAEENPEMVRVGVIENETPVAAAEEVSAVSPLVEAEGRILQTDISSPTWVEEEAEEETVESSPINVSIYEYKPEQVEDDGVKPEDILALSSTYSGNREEKKKTSEMEKTEIAAVIVLWFVANYRYFILAGIIISVIILVRLLKKSLKRTVKKKKEKVQGPEFTEEDNMIVINPMEEGNLSEFMKPAEAEAGEKGKKPLIKPLTEEEERLMDRITRDENGDILIRGGDLSPADAMRLAAMGLDAADGIEDEDDDYFAS